MGITCTDLDDLYFTPNLFSVRDRKAAHMLPSCSLYADLDEVDPAGIESRLVPTIWWATSPGRFQAVWLLDSPLARDSFEHLNKRLTYHLGADRSGWNAAKVLRIPGTINNKPQYKQPYRIRQVHMNLQTVHSTDGLKALLRSVDVPAASCRSDTAPPLPDDAKDGQEVLKRYRRKLRSTLTRENYELLTRDTPVNERSSKPSRLYPRLFQIGMTAEEVLAVTCASALFKHSRQWMWDDICRCQAKQRSRLRSTGRARDDREIGSSA
jgi:hypothetical protein